MQKIVVAFATDHKYHYYTGVALYSLIRHASPESQYEILILADSLTSSDSAIFAKLVEGRTNFTLRILEMREKIAELGVENFYLGSYSIANYYRLFLHELLPQYDRVLYLDSDILVQSDVRELFHMDIGSYSLGAVKDRTATRFPFSVYDLGHFMYFKNKLKLEKPHKYFNSGVLLMNLEKLRKSDFSRRVRDEVASGLPFKFVDQDILNRVFNDKIYYFDETWNYMTIPGDHTEKKKIVHISGEHPWLSITKPHYELWWSVAGKTFFAQDLKKDLYASSERIDYLENIEKSYFAVLQSTCWRMTAVFRAVINRVKWSKVLFDGIVLRRG